MSTDDATAVRTSMSFPLRSFRSAARNEGGNSIRNANYRGESDTVLTNGPRIAREAGTEESVLR